MVARVTHARVSPDDIKESVRLFDESVIPAATQEEGFMGAMLLTRPDGHLIAIDLCDTMENMRENDRNGFYETQVAKFEGKLLEPPKPEFYEMPVARGIKGGWELLV